MAQMKTDSEKSKLNDQKKSKELIQLRKEKRQRENQVKMLELQNRQKDAILKVWAQICASRAILACLV